MILEVLQPQWFHSERFHPRRNMRSHSLNPPFAPCWRSRASKTWSKEINHPPTSLWWCPGQLLSVLNSPPVAEPSAHAANQLSPPSPLPQTAFKTQIIIIKHHKNVTRQSKYTRTPNLLSLIFCPSPYKINFYNFYWQLQPGSKLFSDYCAHISQGRQ